MLCRRGCVCGSLHSSLCVTRDVTHVVRSALERVAALVHTHTQTRRHSRAYTCTYCVGCARTVTQTEILKRVYFHSALNRETSRRRREPRKR